MSELSKGITDKCSWNLRGLESVMLFHGHSIQDSDANQNGKKLIYNQAWDSDYNAPARAQNASTLLGNPIDVIHMLERRQHNSGIKISRGELALRAKHSSQQGIGIEYSFCGLRIDADAFDDPIPQIFEEFAVVASDVQDSRAFHNPRRCHSHAPQLKVAITKSHGVFSRFVLSHYPVHG